MDQITQVAVPRRYRDKWLVLLPCVARAMLENPGVTFGRLPTLMPYTIKSLRSLTLHVFGKPLLKAAYEAAREADMRPFLLWGTLLGCMREGRFIEHDFDIDLGILAADWPKRQRLTDAMLRRGYLLEIDMPYKMRFVTPDYVLRMDIDVLFPWRDKLACRSKEADGKVLLNVFDREAVDELRPMAFLDDVEVLVPGKPERVLQGIYGDWRTPVRDYRYDNNQNRIWVKADDPDLRYPQ